MRRFGFASLLIFALGGVGSAVAADMAVKARPMAPVVAAEYNWSGFYVGVNGGWADQNMFWAYDPAIVGAARQTNAFNWNSGVVGGHIGGQYQFGHIVLGAEAGYIWNDPNWQGFSCPNPVLVCQAKLSNLWTAGGRVGYAWDRFLVYGTGGYASGQINTQVGPTLGVGTLESTSRRHDGWFGGVGVEYAAWKGKFADVIVGAEYTHIDLNQQLHCVQGVVGCVIPSSLNRDLDGHVDMVRARVSLKFSPGVTPVVARY